MTDEKDGAGVKRDVPDNTAIGECQHCGGNANSLLGGEHMWKCSEVVVATRLERYIDNLRHNSERRSRASFDAETAEEIASELEEMVNVE